MLYCFQFEKVFYNQRENKVKLRLISNLITYVVLRYYRPHAMFRSKQQNIWRFNLYKNVSQFDEDESK